MCDARGNEFTACPQIKCDSSGMAYMFGWRYKDVDGDRGVFALPHVWWGESSASCQSEGVCCSVLPAAGGYKCIDCQATYPAEDGPDIDHVRNYVAWIGEHHRGYGTPENAEQYIAEHPGSAAPVRAWIAVD